MIGLKEDSVRNLQTSTSEVSNSTFNKVYVKKKLYYEMNIFTLPKSNTVHILSIWTDLFDLTCLDSAFCNSLSRPWLLNIFQFEFFSLGEHHDSVSCLNYINNRKLKLNVLTLNDNFVTRKNILEMTVYRVRCLKIVSCRCGKLSQQRLVSLINACTLLSGLELDGVQSCTDKVFLQFSPTILKQLKNITIDKCDGKLFTNKSIFHLTLNSGNLFEIVIGTGFGLTTREVDIVSLIQKNIQLTHFGLRSLKGNFTDKMLETLVSCSQLETLVLNGPTCWATDFDPARILQFLVKQCGPKLTGFHLNIRSLVLVSTEEMFKIQAPTSTNGLDFVPLVEKFRDHSTVQLTFVSSLLVDKCALLNAVLLNNPNLTKLIVTDCGDLVPHLRRVYECCPGLRIVHLKDVGHTNHKYVYGSPIVMSVKRRSDSANSSHQLIVENYNLTDAQAVELVDCIPNLKLVTSRRFYNYQGDWYMKALRETCEARRIEFQYEDFHLCW